MAFAIFSPPRAPSLGPSKDTTFRVIEATFGDGYVQSAEDGINNIDDKWDLAWNNILKADADAIEEFIRSKRGAIPFLYTMPGESVQLQWKVKTYKYTPVTPFVSTITATFIRDYTP